MNNPLHKYSKTYAWVYDNVAKAFQVGDLNVENYRYEETYASMDQIIYLNNSLRLVNEAHCHDLAE